MNITTLNICSALVTCDTTVTVVDTTMADMTQSTPMPTTSGVTSYTYEPILGLVIAAVIAYLA